MTASIVLFTLIAALMATALAIEFHRGVPMALQSFELLIFVSALAGIAFHGWQLATARRRSQQLDEELAAARAEVRRSGGCRFSQPRSTSLKERWFRGSDLF